MELEQQPVVNVTKIVFNLGHVDETLDDAILELQDFGDSIYEKSTEFRSKADRLYEIEKKLVACQTYVQELRTALHDKEQTLRSISKSIVPRR